MRESDIKSKLWDQRQFDDDKSWDEGSGGWSSAEEGHQHDCSSSGEDIDATIKPIVQMKPVKRNGNVKPQATTSLLNHNAPVFIPKKDATANPSKASPTVANQKEQAQNVIQFSGDTSVIGNKKTLPLSMKCTSSENKLVTFPKVTQSQQLSPGMLISSDQNHHQIEMEGRHIYEEGEEDDILTHCRKNAARLGDLSPTHSNTNK